MSGMNSKYFPDPMRSIWTSFWVLLALSLGLSACSNIHTGAGINVNLPILPGVSMGVNLGTGGVSAGVNAQSGPVGVGVGVNGLGQVTGRAGVGPVPRGR